MVANRQFKLLDLTLNPGEAIPEKVWGGLSRRTKDVLVRTKFVLRPDQVAGKQRKVA